MILPDKHTNLANSILGWGSVVLKYLGRERTISSLWNKINQQPKMSYNKFILALDFLYILDLVDLRNGLIRRKEFVT